ncbi:MAG: 3-oxoacyl-[acyl-carrier-protein] reductase [Thermodesulfovibrio sp.]|uniref:3-oxoacyl-[acyl-carrier-protein] reductase n=1 Tax=unclassified Thermodesulfovibrio TaxID=2645936 RepID=UPI00083A0CF1|nr:MULTISPECIES: 3-oxoacyl-[acyl-carrier-protein] reductase [unclassified Thermodesulfovibrio]MDI1472847.1 3-oxoacyl-[acyl-carrier-protein] reductase [Thermodesulfovibrio sp. 1176]MDI6714912.1 3-oxoacyl-[acyl-carrier-protein] reductase [Thermodesulfovibrio sp.]ODA44503.1 3-oxoacyl-[acyl-carrier protein] reductase [Thermodesulfovibrio sp. N1]
MKGHTAVITGSSRGIGRTTAEEFAKRGVNIVIVDIDEERAKQSAEEIKSQFGVETLGLKADVSNAEDVKTLFEESLKKFGKIEILVNNAGITKDNLLIRMKDEEWDAVLNINLKGAFLCSREAIKGMSKIKYGRIINIASVVAFTGNPGQVNYSASKAGLIGLTKTLAKEYASRGITVNAVAPGFIQTAMTEKLPEKVKEEMLRTIPLQRFGTTMDVANAIIFLALPESGYITGQVIHVNGGMYM